jgi:hypothetical protein
MPDVIIEWENGIVDIAAHLSMTEAVERCAEEGVLFPLALPLGEATLAQWVAASPPFADAFVASAVLEDAQGRRVDTPRVPRAAMGVDLVGAAFLRQPALVCERLRIRAWPKETLNILTVEGSPHEVMEAFNQRLDMGRDFWVEATSSMLIAVSGAVDRISAMTQEVPALTGAEPQFSGHARWQWGGSWIGEALLSGHRAFAAPFMGRMGFFTSERRSEVMGAASSPISSDVSFGALANALNEKRGGGA